MSYSSKSKKNTANQQRLLLLVKATIAALLRLSHHPEMKYLRSLL
jgi:hypothetical protein